MTSEELELVAQVAADKAIDILRRDFHLVLKTKDFNTSDKEVIATKILATVCTHFDIEPEDISTKSIKGDLVNARFIFYWLTDKYYPMVPNTTMAKITGRRSSTVMYALRSIRKMIKKRKDFKSLVDDIESEFLRARHTDEFYKNLTPINNGKEIDSRQDKEINDQPGGHQSILSESGNTNDN